MLAMNTQHLKAATPRCLIVRSISDRTGRASPTLLGDFPLSQPGGACRPRQTSKSEGSHGPVPKLLLRRLAGQLRRKGREKKHAKKIVKKKKINKKS